MQLFRRLCEEREFRKRLEDSRARLYRMAYAWTHRADLADDLTQETLAKALNKRETIRELQALDAWLFRVLTNCWRDYCRRDRDMVDLDEERWVHHDTPEVLHARGEIVHNVRNAVANLPVGQRQVLTLVDLEGFSYTEVAEILEIPPGTVMSRLSRARNTLKTLLLAGKPAHRQASAPLRVVK